MYNLECEFVDGTGSVSSAHDCLVCVLHPKKDAPVLTKSQASELKSRIEHTGASWAGKDYVFLVSLASCSAPLECFHHPHVL
jgi:hypothetical protein